ncbi:MAG: flagellar motor protein MotA [Aestuariivirgaceae bacterium]|nr:flagellar motor protein MotA [Aestuariivirgaceae bacterium]
MAKRSESTVLDLPRIYLIRMTVFLLVVAVLGAILFPQIQRAFVHNAGLNGFIVLVLLFGIAHAFLQVARLWPEVNWVNSFRIADPGFEVPHTPRLLAPMAALLRDRQGVTVLSPLSMRSLLDSLAARLDESRDLSRYLIGLLIFLGLLGTFWGLLDTVTSVANAIRALDITGAESSSLFAELKDGLEAPLRGMGTSFSSSLFGLAASLVLGFLDLQSTQSQNRFYNDLENWLSSITDIEAGDGGNAQVNVPHYLRLDLRELQGGIERMNKTLEASIAKGGAGDSAATDRLATAVQGLVQQMREEQKIVRQWAQSQSDQQTEIRKMMTRLSPAAPRPRAKED